MLKSSHFVGNLSQMQDFTGAQRRTPGITKSLTQVSERGFAVRRGSNHLCPAKSSGSSKSAAIKKTKARRSSKRPDFVTNFVVETRAGISGGVAESLRSVLDACTIDVKPHSALKKARGVLKVVIPQEVGCFG